jgi:hypothetical protein
VGVTVKLFKAEKTKNAGQETRVAFVSQPAFCGAHVGCLPKLRLVLMLYRNP